jgi:hypothetical protein
MAGGALKNHVIKQERSLVRIEQKIFRLFLAHLYLLP